MSNKEEYFPFKVGDKVVQMVKGGWSFDKKGMPHQTPKTNNQPDYENGKVDHSELEPYMEITGIGRTLFFFVCGGNEHVGSKMYSYVFKEYNPSARSIEDYLGDGL